MKTAIILAVLVAMPFAASAATFTSIADNCGEGCTAIYIDGHIDVNDASKLDRLIGNQNIRKALVYLNSPGGYIAPMVSMGTQIRNAGFWTYVPQNALCTSACATLWLAGRKRFLAPNGQLGFHSSGMKVDGRTVPSPDGDQTLIRYFRTLGLSDDAINYFIASGPGHDISFVTLHKMRQLGIDCDTFPPPMTAETLKPRPSPEVSSKAAPVNEPKPNYYHPTFEDHTNEANALALSVVGLAFAFLVIMFSLPFFAASRLNRKTERAQLAYQHGTRAVSDAMQAQEIGRKAVEEAIGYSDAEAVGYKVAKEVVITERPRSPWAREA
jgi:hypothetical protein